MQGRILIIAGSDSGGGAGIQADIKTVTALGGYAMTAITALTAQNTKGVFDVHAVPLDFIAQQIELVIGDLGADTLKTGMLHSAEVIETVVATLARVAPRQPLVADPVMVAKGGAQLLADAAADTLKRKLLPRALVITPNVPEAEVLTDMTIETLEDMRAAAAMLLAMGPKAVLLKGGHLKGAIVYDLLLQADGREEVFSAPRIRTRHTHGTGCTLASGIATGLAQKLSLRDAVARARAYVLKAIAQAPGYGKGNGPLDHGHTVKPFPVPRTARKTKRAR